MKRSFEHWEQEIKNQIGDNSKFILHSDGACRGDGKSSFAWTIHLSMVEMDDALNQFQQPMCSHRGAVLVGYGATIVDGDHSSFITEAWGIEAAIKSFNNLHQRIMGDQCLKRKHDDGTEEEPASSGNSNKRKRITKTSLF